MCGDFFTRMKICMAIAIGVMLLGKADARLAESAGERLGVENDHTVEEIREAVSGAYEEAEAVMAQRMDGVFEAPYTSSGARAADEGMDGGAAAEGSAGGAGANVGEDIAAGGDAGSADDGIVLHEAAGGSASVGGAAENESVKSAADSIDNGY